MEKITRHARKVYDQYAQAYHASIEKEDRMDQFYYGTMESPVGKILIGVTGKGKRLFLLHYPCKRRPEAELKRRLGPRRGHGK
ncbi:MAG: hypothetical protein WCW52_04560 [Elusimicrobiales bacterium]